jgi:hypothetical protein
MKKYLIYLVSVLCTAGFFTACSDDPDPTIDESWKEISKTYSDQSESLSLSLNGSSVSFSTGKTVAINALSDKEATLTLTNVVPEKATVTINAQLTKTNNVYSLSGETTESNCLIKASGTIEDGVLKMNVTREITLSSIVGDWKLNCTWINETTPPQLVYYKVSADDAVVNATLNATFEGLSQMLNAAIAQSVSSVSVPYKKDGTYGVSWVNRDGTPGGIPDYIASIVQLQYVALDNAVVSVTDKNALLALGGVLDGILSGIGLNTQTVLYMLEDWGGFYGLRVNVKVEGNQATFYLTKDQILPLLPLLSSLLPAEGMEGMDLAPLLEMLPKAQTLEVGLIFSK